MYSIITNKRKPNNLELESINLPTLENNEKLKLEFTSIYLIKKILITMQ